MRASSLEAKDSQLMNKHKGYFTFQVQQSEQEPASTHRARDDHLVMGGVALCRINMAQAAHVCVLFICSTVSVSKVSKGIQ